MSNEHHANCYCDLCGDDTYGWTTCTCGFCDPNYSAWGLYCEYLDAKLTEHKIMHAQICQCDDSMICDTYRHIVSDDHWVGCTCVRDSNFDGNKCCCPLCNRDTFNRIMNEKNDDISPWGELVETLNGAEIRVDPDIGFTVHVTNEIMSASCLNDARDACRPAQKKYSNQNSP